MTTPKFPFYLKPLKSLGEEVLITPPTLIRNQEIHRNNMEWIKCSELQPNLTTAILALDKKSNQVVLVYYDENAWCMPEYVDIRGYSCAGIIIEFDYWIPLPLVPGKYLDNDDLVNIQVTIDIPKHTQWFNNLLKE